MNSKIKDKDIKFELPKPLFRNNRYNNPWDTWKDVTISNLAHYQFFAKDDSDLPNKNIRKYTLPSHKITDEEIRKFCHDDCNDYIKYIWIGHSTSLINIENKIILMDPVFSKRCSPSSILGPKRLVEIPITIDRIPKIDAVIVSHDHYDHLDYQSIIDLNKKFGGNGGLNWFVGVGTREVLISIGIYDNINELTWWESIKFRNLTLVFTPAQHWSLRRLFDYNRCLWGSWVIIGEKKRIFFAGDTGYCSVFSQIGKIYGPFNLSFIPIGAYMPRRLLKEQHINPEEAIKVHLDVKSEKSIGIHWGTFILGREYYLEPKEELEAGVKKYSLNNDSFLTLTHGEINKI